MPHETRGDIATASVESLDYDGNGVAHVGGKVVFIEGAVPGDEVRFRYHNKKKRYDTGRVVEILKPSPDRVDPRCRYFGVCGGCALQHLQSEAQLRAKEMVLRENLAHIGKIQPEIWLPPLRGPVWGYRRKARLGVRVVAKKGGVLVGFREKRHSFITPLETCEVLHPDIASLLPALRVLIGRLSCPERIPQIEVAVGDPVEDMPHAALVFRHLEPLSGEDVGVLREFGEQHHIQLWVQPQGPDSIRCLWPDSGAELVYFLPEQEIVMRFGPTDFVQVNAGANRALVTRALDILDPQADEGILDLFCGLGNFTLPLARRSHRVLGIEADNSLIERARENARHNGIANCEFRAMNLYVPEGPAPWGDEPFDKWLLDPPRTGAIEVIKRLSSGTLRPRRILYVSCNPATLARDSEILVHMQGYRLVSAGVLDMFPHTSHVESMALFEAQPAPWNANQ
ncbi:MAG: 23S rRNA (uracil(1939)-C(5))-methyltransferase RlmD [Acidiferrobacterales bacterium]